MGIVTAGFLFLVCNNYPIYTEANMQFYLCAAIANNQYCVFWTDYRYQDIDIRYAILSTRQEMQSIRYRRKRGGLCVNY